VDGGQVKSSKIKVRYNKSINMAGNIFFDKMMPKQLGRWVRYIKSDLEEAR
jgi:hypothetical protein